MDQSISRREWLRTGMATGAGLAVLPWAASSAVRRQPANEIEEQLRILAAKHRLPGAIAGVFG